MTINQNLDSNFLYLIPLFHDKRTANKNVKMRILSTFLRLNMDKTGISISAQAQTNKSQG